MLWAGMLTYASLARARPAGSSSFSPIIAAFPGVRAMGGAGGGGSSSRISCPPRATVAREYLVEFVGRARDLSIHRRLRFSC